MEQIRFEQTKGETVIFHITQAFQNPDPNALKQSVNEKLSKLIMQSEGRDT